MSSIERRILGALQQGLPGSERPYEEMAREAGIEPSRFLEILKQWKRQGKLRRIGAIVSHFKTSLGAGAMVVWQVKPERVTEVGKILAGFEQVSHAYERDVNEGWPYNLYTMVHGKSIQDVRQVVLQMSRACGISDYRILVTDKELKKVPPTYISQPEARDTRGQG